MIPFIRDIPDVPTPSLSRAQKKRCRRVERVTRQALVRFAGRAGNRTAPVNAVRECLLGALMWTSAQRVRVPRSLREAIGKRIGGPDSFLKSAMRAQLQTVSIYAHYIRLSSPGSPINE